MNGATFPVPPDNEWDRKIVVERNPQGLAESAIKEILINNNESNHYYTSHGVFQHYTKHDENNNDIKKV